MIVKDSEELKYEYDNILNLVKQSREPLYISHNNEITGVLMSVEYYKEREQSLNLREFILDIESTRISGVTISTEEFRKKLKLIDISSINDKDLLVDLSILESEIEYEETGLLYDVDDIFDKFKDKY